MKLRYITAFIIAFFTVTLQTNVSQAQVQIEVRNTITGAVPKNAVRLKFLDIRLTNIGSQTAEIKSVTLERTGLSSRDDFGRIWLETADYRRSFAKRLSNDDQVMLEFRTPIALLPETSVVLSVLGNMNSEGNNRTFAFNVLDVNTTNTVEIISPESMSDPSTQSSSNSALKTSTQNNSDTSRPKPLYPNYSTKSERTPIRYNRDEYQIVCRNSQCELVRKK